MSVTCDFDLYTLDEVLTQKVGFFGKRYIEGTLVEKIENYRLPAEIAIVFLENMCANSLLSPDLLVTRLSITDGEQTYETKNEATHRAVAKIALFMLNPDYLPVAASAA